MKLDKTVLWHPKPDSPLNFRGKKVIVVGGTGGIGRAFARLLSTSGADVIVVGQTFRDAGRTGMSFVKADLSSMREAQRAAEQLPAETADLLIFTTGILAAPKRETTGEGIERDMAVSYLSRFVMLRELAPRLGKDRPKAAGKARVFIMGYPGGGQAGDPDDLNAEQRYKAIPQHMNTVAANEALTLSAAQHNPDLAVFGLNPGMVKSNIRSNFFGGSVAGHVVETLIGWFGPTTDDYAKRIAPLFSAPEIKARSGVLFNRKGKAILPSPALTADRIDRFIEASERLATKAGISAAQ